MSVSICSALQVRLAVTSMSHLTQLMEKQVRVCSITHTVMVWSGALLANDQYPYHAVGGEDFDDGTFTVHFTAGTPLPAMSCTTLNTIDDTNVEGDQDLSVVIESIGLPNRVTVTSPSEQTAIITDDDGMYTHTRNVDCIPGCPDNNRAWHNVNCPLSVSSTMHFGEHYACTCTCTYVHRIYVCYLSFLLQRLKLDLTQHHTPSWVEWEQCHSFLRSVVYQGTLSVTL